MEYKLTNIHGVYDDDTFKAKFLVDNVPSKTLKIRVNGIDCPEIKGRTPKERELALRARDVTERTLNAGTEVTVRVRGVDDYDRVLGDVFIDGVPLKTTLINSGLAKTYEGSKRVWG